MCQGLGPTKYDEISEIDRNSEARDSASNSDRKNVLRETVSKRWVARAPSFDR